VKKENFS